MARLAAIAVYPFKALDPAPVEQVRVLAGGSLDHDRRFAILDAEGNYVNGKRYPAVHQLRSAFDPARRVIQLWTEPQSGTPRDRQSASFHAVEQRADLVGWLSNYFGFPCRVVENAERGFPDDTVADGPTIISTATLREVASWFPGLTLEQTRRRFRANLEIDGVEPFWEDQLFGPAGSEVRFRVGQVKFIGVNPCRRCVVPSRCPDTGVARADFARTFSQRRRETLPPWANVERFDHYYRLAVNTRISPESRGRTVMHVGDEVHI